MNIFKPESVNKLAVMLLISILINGLLLGLLISSKSKKSNEVDVKKVESREEVEKLSDSVAVEVDNAGIDSLLILWNSSDNE